MNDKLKTIGLYLLGRLQESSTVRGLASVLTLLFGVTLTDAQIGVVVAAAAMVDALLKMLLPDQLKSDK